jgi:signal transduction histidine kinase
VKRRLVASYVAVALVILVVLEVPLGIVYARHERDTAASALIRDAEALAAVAVTGLQQPGVDLKGVVDQYRANGGDVAIFNARGAVVVPPGGDESELLTGPVRTEVSVMLTRGAQNGVHGFDRGELFSLALVGSADHRIGAVAVSAADTHTSHRIRVAMMALILAAAVMLAAVAVLGWFVARSVSRPLTALQDAAVRLGRGDLTARSSVASGPPEVTALGKSFNTMAARLEELVTAHRAFAGDASHQLRSPLTALRLRLENLAADLPGTQASDVDEVLMEADRLSRIVDGLLALARSEGQRPQREEIDLTALVADRHAAWHPFAEERGVELQYDPASPPTLVWAVPGYLDQILDNLISNAIEATPAGRAIHLRVAQERDRVALHVTDEGIGMSDTDRAHAADRFWRGAGSRPNGGTGLGLAIVGQLARACEAVVELLAAPSGGIDAVVRLIPVTGAQQPPSARVTNRVE